MIDTKYNTTLDRSLGSCELALIVKYSCLFLTERFDFLSYV